MLAMIHSTNPKPKSNEPEKELFYSVGRA